MIAALNTNYAAMLEAASKFPGKRPMSEGLRLRLARAALKAGCASDAALFISALRGKAEAHPTLERIMADAQLKDLLKILWGKSTLSYLLVLNDRHPFSARTRCLAEVLMAQGKTVYLIPSSLAGSPPSGWAKNPFKVALSLDLPSGTAQVLSPGEGHQARLSLPALLPLIKKRTGTKKNVAIVYATSRLGDLTHALHDFHVLYSNPGSEVEFKYACYMGGNHRACAEPPPSFSILHAENRSGPRFSIVIPTRNSAFYLESGLRTILEQDFDDFEIVIGDNSTLGNEETSNLVKRLNSEKIRYFRANHHLCLPDSFEFAHSHCRGEYVLGLGSDDGMLFHGLKTLAKVIDDAGRDVDALKFDFLFYGWPTAMPHKFKHFFRIPPTIVKRDGGLSMEWVDSKEMLDRYMGFQTLFHNVPNGYGYSLLSRRLLGRLKRTLGRVFPGNSQDTYTSTFVLALTDAFLRLDFPITAFAVSGKSVGSQFEYGGTEQTRVRHMLELSRAELGGYASCDSHIKKGLHEEVCGFLTQDLLNAENLADAVKRKLLPPAVLDRMDWDRYFRRCLECVYEGDALFKEKMKEIGKKIQRRNRPDIEAWFRRDFLHNPDFKGVQVPTPAPFRYGLLPNRVLYLNASDFGVTNVYEAAQLFQKISHL